jgi:hypothetical protein
LTIDKPLCAKVKETNDFASRITADIHYLRIHGYWKEMFSLFIGAYFIKDNLDIQTFQIIEG